MTSKEGEAIQRVHFFCCWTNPTKKLTLQRTQIEPYKYNMLAVSWMPCRIL